MPNLRRSPVPGTNPTAVTEESTRQPRITPRNSEIHDTSTAATVKDTPYGTLRQLANLPKPTTPLRRASSAGPTSHRSAHRTPIIRVRTPGAVQRAGGSARRANVLTPHGRAAQREVEARRAGFTPGKDRRRSGRQQRETPRDLLRGLSRILATKTELVQHTPDAQDTLRGRFRAGVDDEDDGPDPVRPRLSMPLGDDEDEDDSLLLPPRSTGLEDEDYTAQSVEFGRRAISEQPLGRLSRGSFGSVRMSDQFEDLREGGFADSSLMMGRALYDEDLPGVGEDLSFGDLGFEGARMSLGHTRESDIRQEDLAVDETEDTFVFQVPQRDATQRMEAEEATSILPNSDIRDFSRGDEGEEVENEEEDDDDDDDVRTMGLAEQIDASMQDTTMGDLESSVTQIKKPVSRKKVKISKHGIQYPSLPAGVVKKLATTFAKSGNSKAKISKDTLEAIMQASDWFFEQVSDDLGAYSNHAGRKTIDESDVISLMKRQRQVNATTTPFSLAQRFLPRELLQELRMVPPPKLKKGRQLERVAEDEDEDEV